MQVTAGKTYTFGVQGLSGLGEYGLTLQLTPTFTGLGIVSSRTMNNQRVSGREVVSVPGGSCGHVGAGEQGAQRHQRRDDRTVQFRDAEGGHQQRAIAPNC